MAPQLTSAAYHRRTTALAGAVDRLADQSSMEHLPTVASRKQDPGTRELCSAQFLRIAKGCQPLVATLCFFQLDKVSSLRPAAVEGKPRRTQCHGRIRTKRILDPQDEQGRLAAEDLR